MNASRAAGPLSRWLYPLAWIVVLAMTTFAGYQSLFSTHAEYDDEGYVMMSLANFMKGHELYDATYSQYGPGFFHVTAAVHRFTGLPITHTAIRFKTLVIWTLLAGLASAIVFRLTRSEDTGNSTTSRWFALATFVVAFFHLDKMPLEPGHPQEVCALFVMLAAFIATLAGLRTLGLVSLLGILCGLTITCKLNVGIFLALAVGIAFVAEIELDRMRRALLTVSVAIAWLIGFALYKPYLADWSAIQFPLLCLAALSLVASTAWPTWNRSTARSMGPRVRASATHTHTTRARRPMLRAAFPIATVVGVSLLTAAGILAITNWSGTTWAGLKYGLIGQHAGFAGGFFHPVIVKNFAMPLLMVSLASAVFGEIKFKWVSYAVACLTLLAIGLTHVSESNMHVTHGLNPRGAHGLLISAGLAGLWIMGSAKTPSLRGRTILALIACLQPLIAFPVSGSQVAFGTLPLLVGCFVLAADGWRAFAVAKNSISTGRSQWSFYATGVSLVLLATVLLNRSVCNYRYRESRVPLGLHGAEDIRLDPKFVEKQRWLVEQIQNNADTFVFTQHTRNSVYFWANVAPPNAVNATFWPFMLNEQEQSSVVSSLSDYDRVAIINEPHYESVPDGPLVAHLETHQNDTSEKSSNGKTQVWVVD